MNQEDRKILSEIDEGISTHLVALEELVGSLDERIERILEHFQSGNQVSEQLEQERDQLQEALDAVEEAKNQLGDLL